jgi:DNA-binding Lrp family transcriptional regulator
LRLDEKEIKVLSYIHLKADSSISEISSATGLKSHTVRYVLDSFIKNDMLRPFLMFNRKSFGYDTISSYFKIKPSYSEQRKLILDEMIRHSSCCWLSPLVGDYEYGIAITVTTTFTIHTFFQELSNKFGSFLGDRVYSLDNAWYYLGKKYLLGSSFKSEPLVVKATNLNLKLEELDLKILKMLIAYPLGSESKIAKELNLPNSTLNNRTQKLKDKGAIGGYIYGINYSKIGVFAYRILADFGGMGDELFENFLSYSKNHKHITSFNRCT